MRATGDLITRRLTAGPERRAHPLACFPRSLSLSRLRRTSRWDRPKSPEQGRGAGPAAVACVPRYPRPSPSLSRKSCKSFERCYIAIFSAAASRAR